MRRKRTVKNLTEEDIRILEDKSITPDVVSFMVNIPTYMVVTYRHRKKYAESLKKASAKFRAKQKKQNEKKFGKIHGCYNYWTQEEIEYLVNSTEPDSVIAEKLNRTVSAIQKKRQREIEKGGN